MHPLLPINLHALLLSRWASIINSVVPKGVYQKNRTLFVSSFQSLFGSLIQFDSIVKNITVCFRVHFILKDMEAIFLGNIFRHVLLLYIALYQLIVELILVNLEFTDQNLPIREYF